MSKPRTELKVGIFVIISIVLVGALVITFNKGAGPLTSTYNIRMRAKDVSGVIPGSVVLMAGVKIGSIEKIELDSASGNVDLLAKLYSKYALSTNSQFLIRQSGFLGDQYIGVYQGAAKEVLTNGSIVECEAPFDLGEVARSTGGLVKRVDSMVGQLSNAVARVDTTLLSRETLTNLAQTVSNFRSVSERTLTTLNKLDNLIETNSPWISASVTNAHAFTVHLNELASELRQTLATNREQLTASVHNIEKATAKLDVAMGDVNAGKGLAGALIKNEQLATDMSLIVSNLQILSSNINNKGLWGVLRKPKK